MWLSGTFPAKGSVIRLNTTVDQIIAQQIGQGTPFPSIELATEDHSSHLGSCAGDFLCSYMSTISWRTPTQPLPMEINPRVVFERMFGGDAATPQERRARLERNSSILDAVGESVARPAARPRRRAIAPSSPSTSTTCARSSGGFSRPSSSATETLLDVPPTPIGVPESWEEHVKLMFDLMALAYQGNLTRVVVVHDGARAQHAQLSADRRRRRPSPGLAQQQRAGAGREEGQDRHRTTSSCSRDFLEQLQSTPDGDGNLLDHSMFLYGSGMSNGNLHTHDNLPILLVGGAAGRLKGDRHLKFKANTPLSNLMIALLDKAGVPTEKFGESSGRIEL